jgi:hypothetical protein
VLKKGREIKGEIVAKDADSVQIRTPLGLVRLQTAQISSLVQAPPEVKESLQRIQVEIEELQVQKSEFGAMIHELIAASPAEPADSTSVQAAQNLFSPGPLFALGFIALCLILFFFGLSLRPKKEITIVFIILLALGILDWLNVLNPCESPFFYKECLDYPYNHHPELFPGLFPPLLFDEGCAGAHQKIVSLFGWKCEPISWQVDEWVFCRANCSVNHISWAYTALYWYLLACIIMFIPDKFRKKEFTL